MSDHCPAALVLKGEFIACDVPAPHDGWPHSSMRVEAVWGDGTPMGDA